jgi:hypothetical protein
VNSDIVMPVDMEQFVEAIARVGMCWVVLNERPGR